jgi:Mce-associated membrane protein
MTGPRRLEAVLAVALAAALVAVALLWVDRDDAPASTRAGSGGAEAGEAATLLAAGSEAEAAARSAVEQMTTYDFSTVEEDFTWVEDAGTEQFQAYFAGASKDAIAVIRSLKASASGTVVDAAPQVIDATHVKVLLFVDQEITARKQQGSKLDQPRVSMQMVRQDGRWLVDQVAVNDLLAQ